MELKKSVLGKWRADLAVVYRIGNLVVHYSSDKDPLFFDKEELTESQVRDSKPYKAYQWTGDDCLPTDVVKVVPFTWLGKGVY